jgi:hypothetical protein
MALAMKLPECTLNYCDTLWKAKQIGGEGDPKHSCVLAFDEGTDLSELNALLKQAAKETFGDDFPPNAKWPLKKGEDVFPGKKGNPSPFQGKLILSSATGEQPTMVCRLNGKLVDIIDQAQLYAGCRVEAYVGIAGYNKKVNKGVGVYVNGLLKTADGEHLGGGKPDAESMFGSEGADTQQAEIQPGGAAGVEADATPKASNPWD